MMERDIKDFTLDVWLELRRRGALPELRPQEGVRGWEVQRRLFTCHPSCWS